MNRQVLATLQFIYHGQEYHGPILLSERIIRDALKGGGPTYHAWTWPEVAVMLLSTFSVGFLLAIILVMG